LYESSALCYRSREDIEHLKMKLLTNPKSIQCRNKEFNRNFRYLEYVPQLDGLISVSISSVNNHFLLKQENSLDEERLIVERTTDDEKCEES